MQNDLIERLGSATGPDRNIDKALAPLVGLRMVEEGHPLGSCCYDEKGHGVPLPAFTASIDAALTLVGDNHWRVEDHPMAGPCAIVGDIDAYAPTPALALCIAALRATERTEPSR